MRLGRYRIMSECKYLGVKSFMESRGRNDAVGSFKNLSTPERR